MLKTMMEYKCAHAGVVFEEVNESYTTQTCSCCREIPASSPKQPRTCLLSGIIV
ncbi:transposase (plasmid) [Shewanella decolorationis]|nr:transposase [Shewanella decolorationis]QXN27253.1 transposase [Shewanella putrefaciens]